MLDDVPDGAGDERGGRQVEGLAGHQRAGERLLALVADDAVLDLGATQEQPGRADAPLGVDLKEPCAGVAAGDRVGGAVVGFHRGHARIEIELHDPPVLTLVEV